MKNNFEWLKRVYWWCLPMVIFGNLSCDNSSEKEKDYPTFPYIFQIDTFFDSDLKDIEPSKYIYDFDHPVASDVLSENSYEPKQNHSYFKSPYGPRYLSNDFDNHAGMDIDCNFSYEGIYYDCDSNPPFIKSMCDGEVYKIDDNNLRSVYIKCDQEFNQNPGFGKIRIIYRHLEYISDKIFSNGSGSRIQKGDTLGLMGKTGANSVHLHLSVRPEHSNKNLITTRIFDINSTSHLSYLESGDVRILHSSEQRTVIRIGIPGNQFSTKYIKISDPVRSKTYKYDFEEVIKNESESNIDDPGYIKKMEIYAYPYNGYETACQRWADYQDQVPISYPAKEAFPIRCEGVYDHVSNVYDVVINDNITDYAQLSIAVVDVFGNGIKTVNY